MKPLPKTFVRFMWMLGTIAPPLAAAIGYRLFWFLGTPLPVRPSEKELHQSAARSHLAVEGKQVAVYTWGTGDRVVLLVHGWRSRASRFATIVRMLESAGYTVVSFDAPGHGESSGKQTNLLEYVDVIRQLSERHGRFEAIVGYSFGVLASFVAIGQGVSANRIISIAGPHGMRQVFARFVSEVGLTPRAAARVRRRFERWFERRLGRDAQTLWGELVSELPAEAASTPLLVIHDDADAAVSVDQAHLIAAAHDGAELVITSGLGHNRILSDDRVIQRIRDFMSAPARGTFMSAPARTK